LLGLNTKILDKKSKQTGFAFGNNVCKFCFVLLGKFFMYFLAY